MNEKGCATTANGGICAFTGKDNRGVAWTSDNDPKRRRERLRKAMPF